MTLDEILTRLRSKPLTPERRGKLERLCQRMQVSYEAVLRQLSAEEKAALGV